MTHTSRLLAVSLALLTSIPATASLPELTRRYSRDDGLLDRALRYERTQNETRDLLWALETGEMVKVATHTKTAQAATTAEYSLDADGAVYFAFHRVLAPLPDGGTRVTEERAYYEESQTIQFSRRTADFPAGTIPEIPAKTLSVKVPLDKLAEGQADNLAPNEKTRAIIKTLRTPEFLVHDPAKDAPAEWRRVKLIEGSLSPDGRYALAWAPAKKDFDWKDYVEKDAANDYWVEPESEPVVNFLADLKTHTVLGTVPGVHFGVKRNYNHYECVTVWSPDAAVFIELNTRKWDYAACCIGRVKDGKPSAVQNLGAAVEARARDLLKTTKHQGYKKHSKNMVVALAGPVLNNDGSGSMEAVFQVPKSEEEGAYATVSVGFRLAADKNRVETPSAKLVADP